MPLGLGGFWHSLLVASCPKDICAWCTAMSGLLVMDKTSSSRFRSGFSHGGVECLSYANKFVHIRIIHMIYQNIIILVAEQS